MPRVRYTADGGHYRVGGHGFDPGDEQDVDDELAEHLETQEDFKIVGDGDGKGDDPDPDPDELEDLGPVPFNPDDHTVPEIEDELEAVDDADVVRALKQLEKTDGDDRDTAEKAFDARIAELEG